MSVNEDKSSNQNVGEPEDWLEEHGDSLFRYALTRVRNTDTAEELVQETLIAGWRNRDRFDGRSSVSTWLFSILRNKLIDFLRVESRQARIQEQHRDTVRDSETLWPSDPAKDLENDEFWKIFFECVAKLPPKLSEAYTLREINESSTQEACEILGITANNFSARLRRARLALRDCLQLHWFSH